MSEKIRVICVHCGKALNVPAILVGRNGKCPSCQNSFKIESQVTVRPGPAKQGTVKQAPVGTGAENRTAHAKQSQARGEGQQVPPRRSAQREPVPRNPPELASQPSHREEFATDGRRLLAAVSSDPDKYAIVEPYLMGYEQPLAIAVQRRFPFSVFADIVLLTSHRLMVFKRFFTKIDMVDVNYVDFKDVTVKQGFFTSTFTILADDHRSYSVGRLVTGQALNMYRMCQDVETKARMARRQFQLEENRSKTTTMQVNNLVAPNDGFQQSQRSSPRIPHQDISAVGDEEIDPYRLGD